MSSAVPEGWNIRTVSEVSNNLDGKRVPLKSTDRATRQGRFRYFGASGVIDYVDDFIFDGDYILLGEDGENVLSRNLPLAFIVSGKFWVNNHAHVLQPKDGIDIGYLCEYLESLDYRDIASGSAQPKVTQGSLNKIRVVVPPLPEQKKIASILTSVDEVIEKTESQITKLQDLKTGMMQELLTKGIGHTEFKDSLVGKIPVEWKVKSIGSLGSVVTGSTPKTSCPENYGGVIPFVSPADINQSMYIGETKSTISKQGLRDTREIPDNSVCVVCIGSTIGKCAITNFVCATNQQINSIICKDSNPQYVYYLMTHYSNFIKSEASTQAVPIINKSAFSAILVQVPPLDEQVKIGESIASVDKKLSLLHRKSIELTNSKKALMQDLLTGKVGVKTD